MSDKKELVIKGHKVEFVFPNLFVCAEVEASGFGEKLLTNYEKAVEKDKVAEFLSGWPRFIKAAVVNPPEWMLDAKNLTAGETFAIAAGFINTRSEIREN